MQQVVQDVEVAEIFPDPLQPRRHFDEEELSVLAGTLKVGQIEPIWVVHRETDDIPPEVRAQMNGHQYLIMDGERRWRACQRIKKGKIQATVLDCSYTEAYHRAVIKHKTTARHNEIEKARGIISDLENHLQDQHGFEDLDGGASTMLHLIDRVSRGKQAPPDWFHGLKEVTERVCASAGYSVNSVRTQILPLVNLNEDLEAMVGQRLVDESDEERETRTQRREEIAKREADLIEDRKVLEEERKQLKARQAALENQRKDWTGRQKESEKALTKAKKALTHAHTGEQKSKIKAEMDSAEKKKEKAAKEIEKRREAMEEATTRNKELLELQRKQRDAIKHLNQEAKDLDRQEKVASWTVPATTLVTLNSLPQQRRDQAVEFVKKHMLSRIPSTQLARVLRSEEEDLIEPLLEDRLTPAVAAKLLELEGEERDELLGVMLETPLKGQGKKLKELRTPAPAPLPPPLAVGVVSELPLEIVASQLDFPTTMRGKELHDQLQSQRMFTLKSLQQLLQPRGLDFVTMCTEGKAVEHIMELAQTLEAKQIIPVNTGRDHLDEILSMAKENNIEFIEEGPWQVSQEICADFAVDQITPGEFFNGVTLNHLSGKNMDKLMLQMEEGMAILLGGPVDPMRCARYQFAKLLQREGYRGIDL